MGKLVRSIHLCGEEKGKNLSAELDRHWGNLRQAARTGPGQVCGRKKESHQPGRDFVVAAVASF